MDYFEMGRQKRMEVLGAEYVKDREARRQDDQFWQEFQRYVTDAAWGQVWTRPGLDARTRSIISVTAIAVLGREHELALHLPGAVRNGLTFDELRELAMHMAPYAGIPAAIDLMRCIEKYVQNPHGSDGE